MRKTYIEYVPAFSRRWRLSVNLLLVNMAHPNNVNMNNGQWHTLSIALQEVHMRATLKDRVWGNYPNTALCVANPTMKSRGAYKLQLCPHYTPKQIELLIPGALTQEQVRVYHPVMKLCNWIWDRRRPHSTHGNVSLHLHVQNITELRQQDRENNST
jgi:hypothetical protein